MIDKISEVLNDDSHLSKSFVMSQFQRCFAIKTGVNGFLDIARLTYSELLGDFNGDLNIEFLKKYDEIVMIRPLFFFFSFLYRGCGKFNQGVSFAFNHSYAKK